MTSFSLKIIGLISMVLDHIKYAIPDTTSFVTQYFGRIGFPIFAFLITQAWVHTKNKKKYVKRLSILALISEIPWILLWGLVSNQYTFNILFTFLLAILGMIIYDFLIKTSINKIFKYFIITISLFIIVIFAEYINVAFGWFGVATVWVFYIFKSKKFVSFISFILIVLLYFYLRVGGIIEHINPTSVLFTLIPGILLLFYNGKEGKKMKHLFYIFYPMHMIILYAINIIFIK